MREKISVVDYIKKTKIGIILVCLAIFVFIVNAVVSSAFYDSRLSLYKSEKQTLTADLERAKIDAQTSTSGAQEISSGLDMKRVAKDDEVFNKFLTDCLSWKSLDEYVSIRDKLIDKYKSNSVSTFITVMFPDLYNYSDEDDVSHPVKDFVSSTTLSIKNVVSHVVMIDSNVYSYFTEVTLVSSNSKKCNVVMTYSVDENGELSNLGAYVVD